MCSIPGGRRRSDVHALKITGAFEEDGCLRYVDTDSICKFADTKERKKERDNTREYISHNMAEKHTKGSSLEIETRLSIDGQFVKSAEGKTFPVFSPATGEKVVDVYAADVTDVDRAVQCAKRAFPSWSETEGMRKTHIECPAERP